MNRFIISANSYLSKNVTAFFNVPYVRMGNPGNPNYLNNLKNTFNDFLQETLQSSVQELKTTLQADLPQVLRSLVYKEMVVCVVPRAKSEGSYHANQQLFRSTVKAVVIETPGFVDGTNYLCRHTDTKTTHLRNPVQNYTNNGADPYPGILKSTCDISPNVAGKDILLIDDIYTPGINIDEDAISSLLKSRASSVTFYAVGKV